MNENSIISSTTKTLYQDLKKMNTLVFNSSKLIHIGLKNDVSQLGIHVGLTENRPDLEGG